MTCHQAHRMNSHPIDLWACIGTGKENINAEAPCILFAEEEREKKVNGDQEEERIGYIGASAYEGSLAEAKNVFREHPCVVTPG
eukprot:1003979-Pelagomonas_calceolata.AAC.2